MNKEELRLAVVIYGGASLAVYMHGVTKELFKLVQASKSTRELLHEQPQAHSERPPLPAQPNTEDIYRDLLLQLNAQREFRVVIDVIAGASAGAINGIMLAKALAHDLPLEQQTDLWLEKADVDHLADTSGSAWRRWYLVPFLKGFVRLLPVRFRSNPETRRKLEKFLRLSWLSPPLSGERLCGLLFDALARAGTAKGSDSSLLPTGQRLDFYASITDLFGYPRSFRLNEVTVAREQEPAVVSWLSHQETREGRKLSDFRDANDPALVWTARASSSYAGAFAPFHHNELLRVLRTRGQEWDATAFLRRKLLLRDAQPAHEVFDPADRYFLDGGIVNNKPFAAALDALQHRPTDRTVDRCIVYIEPTPNQHDAKDPQRFLRFLGTIRAAVSSIPRNQPILSELTEVANRDAHARINQRLVDHNRKAIRKQITAELRRLGTAPLTQQALGALRRQMTDRAREQMGLAYESYVQRRVWHLSEAIVAEWRLLVPGVESSDTELAMMASVEQWLSQEPRNNDQAHDRRGSDEPARPFANDPHRTFLRRFDVGYRMRRLQFVIRSLNHRLAEGGTDSQNTAAAAGALKQVAYEQLQRLARLRRADGLDPNVLAQLAAAGTRLPLSQHDAILMLRLLSRVLRLTAFDTAADAALASCCNDIDDVELRDSVIADYTGFAFYDVLFTAAGSELSGSDPMTRIRLERISPEDSSGLQVHFRGLRSRDLMSFAGFFNRSYREHDYLWGRLNGADRVVDLLANAAGPNELDTAQQQRLRISLFNAILASERDRLTACQPLIARLEAELQREAERPA